LPWPFGSLADKYPPFELEEVKAARREALQPTLEALRAHLEEGTRAEPITDPAVLAELFGMGSS
jgi:hypothetical protein